MFVPHIVPALGDVFVEAECARLPVTLVKLFFSIRGDILFID